MEKKSTKVLIVTVVLLAVIAGAFIVFTAINNGGQDAEVVEEQGQGTVSFEVVDPTEDASGKVAFTVVEPSEE